MLKKVAAHIKRYNPYSMYAAKSELKGEVGSSYLTWMWWILDPVLFMLVYVFITVVVFRSRGEYLPVVVIIGLTVWNFFNKTVMVSVKIVNTFRGIVSKIYIPKYIFPLSKCLFVGINFLLTLIPLYAVIILTGTGLNVYHLLLPISFVFLFLFTLGMGMILATISVFLRDMFYIYGIVLTIMTYFTPIMYDISMLDPIIQKVLKLNPLYHYITFARTIILYDQVPSLRSFVICGASCLIVFIAGVIIFKKNQDKFIYYM